MLSEQHWTEDNMFQVKSTTAYSRMGCLHAPRHRGCLAGPIVFAGTAAAVAASLRASILGPDKG